MLFPDWLSQFYNSTKYTAGISCSDIYPVRFGMNSREIISLFGKPDDVSTIPAIVKYGDVAFHFDNQFNNGLFLIFSDSDENNFSVICELSLYLQLEKICEALVNGEHGNRFCEGHELLKEYKNKGMNRQKAWNTIYALYMKYNHADDEPKIDLTADWLDCICGYIGDDSKLY